MRLMVNNFFAPASIGSARLLLYWDGCVLTMQAGAARGEEET